VKKGLFEVFPKQKIVLAYLAKTIFYFTRELITKMNIAAAKQAKISSKMHIHARENLYLCVAMIVSIHIFYLTMHSSTK